MKASSLGQYIQCVGKAVNEQQLFIKKLLGALKLIKPQSKEFSNQIITLNQEFDEILSNQNLEPSEEVSNFDLNNRQIQKDIESINIQLRVLKSANATSRKGQGAPDLTAIEKSKKLKQSFKEYQNESSAEIYELKNTIAKNSSELKNSGETITTIQANLQAIRDELNVIKARIQKEEHENIASNVKDMQEEIEALKSLTEVIHKGIVSKDTLIKMKQADERTINILKNSIQNLKDEVKNIKLLKQGKVPTSFVEKFESFDQTFDAIKEEIQSVKEDIDAKSSLILKAQEELSEIRNDTAELKNSQIETDNPSLPERMNAIEGKMNTITERSVQIDEMFNSQKEYMTNLKEELLPDITNRVSQIETQVHEMTAAENSELAAKNKSFEEYEDLSQKVEQMIHDIQTSNISKRTITNKKSKPNVPRTVDTLRTFQKALMAQEQAEQNSVYNNLEPSHLPLVVQSMDQLLKDVYTEMYKIRDHLSKEITDMKKNSIPLKVDDYLKKEE